MGQEALVEDSQKALSWWREHAWSEDTFDLLLSSYFEVSNPAGGGGGGGHVLNSFKMVVDNGEYAPDSEFCFRLGASVTLGRRVTVDELEDPVFINNTWELMSRDRRATSQELLSTISWHLLCSSAYANVLELGSKPTKGSKGGYLHNPNLSAERLREAWSHYKEKITGRDFTFHTYAALVENPSLPSDVAADMVDKFVWVLFTDEGKDSFRLASERERDLAYRLLIKLLSVPSLPRGVFERHIEFFHAPLPTSVRGYYNQVGSTTDRAQVLMPWYSTKEEVTARWEEVFGPYAELAPRASLTSYENLNLSGVPALDGLFPTVGRGQPGRQDATPTSEGELLEGLEKMLDSEYSDVKGLVVAGGEYSEEAWVLIYRFLSQPPRFFFAKQTAHEFKNEAFEGENTPDWVRFALGVNNLKTEDMQGRWLMFHGGACAYAEELGLAEVPTEWAVKIVLPAGLTD